jgi:uncharacterized protein with von Willebrand factor type A (vWA) domain
VLQKFGIDPSFRNALAMICENPHSRIETGVGWEPAWDIVLKGNQFNVTRFGGIRPKKQHARQRNREERAKKLEENLETRLDKMEEHYVNKESLREVDESFEGRFKRMTKG